MHTSIHNEPTLTGFGTRVRQAHLQSEICLGERMHCPLQAFDLSAQKPQRLGTRMRGSIGKHQLRKGKYSSAMNHTCMANHGSKAKARAVSAALVTARTLRATTTEPVGPSRDCRWNNFEQPCFRRLACKSKAPASSSLIFTLLIACSRLAWPMAPSLARKSGAT